MTSEQIPTPTQTEVIEHVKAYFASTLEMVCSERVSYDVDIEERECESESINFRIPFFDRRLLFPGEVVG